MYLRVRKRGVKCCLNSLSVGSKQVAAAMRGFLTLALPLALLMIGARPAVAQIETVLYSFGNQSGDGAFPYSGLAVDKNGNFFGTTYGGGPIGGYGTVFELTPTGTERVLYAFGSQPGDGNGPSESIRDAKGNLYGTTEFGGAYGYGTVFKLTPNGTETVLHSFGGQSGDGYGPYAGLVMDSSGNLYGTTSEGGGGSNCHGTVFKLTPTGTESILHSFCAKPDGSLPDGKNPIGGLRLKGTFLYGTTEGDGVKSNGTVFKVSLTGAEKVLYSFGGKAGDGITPTGSLVFDKLGNLYGTTQSGGASGAGTVFKLTSKATETVLYSFGGTPDGYRPLYGALIFDAAGNLYGTTSVGGANGTGVVFKLVP